MVFSNDIDDTFRHNIKYERQDEKIYFFYLYVMEIFILSLDYS